MKKATFFLAISLAFFTACNSQNTETGYKATDNNIPAAAAIAAPLDLDLAAFKAKMQEPGVVVLDVRTPPEVAQGKIEGAQVIDFKGANFAADLDKLDKDKTYLVYCKAGGRSSKTCDMLSEKGFKNVYNLVGGYDAWSKGRD